MLWQGRTLQAAHLQCPTRLGPQSGAFHEPQCCRQIVTHLMDDEHRQAFRKLGFCLKERLLTMLLERKSEHMPPSFLLKPRFAWTAFLHVVADIHLHLMPLQFGCVGVA